MILVTGGSGLVGKHLKDVLPDAVYISSRDYDLMDLNRVDDMMSFFKPKIVIHLAARVGNEIVIGMGAGSISKWMRDLKGKV